ncbi:MAG: efflux RND transporter periplasmic adaptor subunit [Planctomycetota bacterium]|jgi:HlyD family secretion protein
MGTVKKILIIAIILAVVGVAVGIWQGVFKVKVDSEDADQTAAVERGPLSKVVACTGRVVSNLDVQIKCRASGEVIQLPFDVSDPVEKGALLLELDPVNEQRTLHQVRITLSASEARLVIAKKNLEIAQKDLVTAKEKAQVDFESAKVCAADARVKADRMKKLLEKKLGSQEEYDTAETTAVRMDAAEKSAEIRLAELETLEASLEVKRQDIQLAQARVDTDKIAVQLAEDRLKYTKVNAPISGVVTTRNVEPGQIISSGISNVGGGTTVLTVSDLSRMFVLATVDESDIGRVRLDQPAEVTADAFPGKIFPGQVVRIATRGVNVSNVVTFEVKIEVTGGKGSLLRPEMTANVEIVTEKKEDILTVPAEAITTRDGKHFVDVVGAGETTEEREVETGIGNGTRTQIVSGSKEGEKVIVKRGAGESRWNSEDRKRGKVKVSTN